MQRNTDREIDKLIVTESGLFGAIRCIRCWRIQYIRILIRVTIGVTIGVTIRVFQFPLAAIQNGTRESISRYPFATLAK